VSSGAAPRLAGPGAVVIGGDHQGLGIVRSLGRHGIPTCIIDDEPSIARFSRYATHAVGRQRLSGDDELVSALYQAHLRWDLQGWVVFPTRDETVGALARVRDRLVSRYRIPTPCFDVVATAWDKRLTYDLAVRLGLPIPRTWRLDSASELGGVDGPPPYAVKPAIKEHFMAATHDKAWRADSREELAVTVRRAAQIIPIEEVLVQEVVPGGGDHQFSYCALRWNGATVASMTVRRLRQHPPEFGRASTFVETIDSAEVAAAAETFLGAVGLNGLAEVEFKYDDRTGEYKLLDVNPRTWGYHTLGVASGVDFAYLLFRLATDQPVRLAAAVPGMRWVRLATDLPMAAMEMRRGRIRPRAYVASLRSADTESVFCRDDRVPALAELALLPYLALSRGI
jgi:predicted ATP-grasp superfamily ATP-dependent carboligase